MKRNILLAVAAGVVLTVVIAPKLMSRPNTQTSSAGGKPAPAAVELLNVSNDPTREVWQELNAAFKAQYEPEANVRLQINMSHGGSASQARAIIDGLEADVAALGLWSDTNALFKKGLLNAGWEERLPRKSLPFVSTIVFVVREGNPKAIKDWPDLIKPDVVVVTPNPKTSGNGKLSFLAAWGSVVLSGGDEKAAQEFVDQLYQHTPILDAGARGATSTFAQKGIGDVHLTWESEAYLEIAESKGDLEVVYPPRSIRAEAPIAVVDANVDRKQTRAHAQAYADFAFSEAGQEIFARHYYRPTDEKVLAKYASTFPAIEIFPITAISKGWDAAQTKFFTDGAIFDSITASRSSK